MQAVTDKFKAAVVSSNQQVATLAVVLKNGMVQQTLNVEPSASVTTDRAQAQRRTASITVAPAANSGLIPTTMRSLLSPNGNEIALYRGLTFPDGKTELCAQGVFPITADVTADTGADRVLNLTLSDRSYKVSSARLQDVYVITQGSNVVFAIRDLIQFAVTQTNSGYNGPPVDFSGFKTTTFTTPQIVLATGDDPWAKSIEMATAIGFELYFDVNGVCVCQPIPNPSTQFPVWTYADNQLSIMLGLNRVQDLSASPPTSTGGSSSQSPNSIIRDGAGSNVGVPFRATAAVLNPTSPSWVGNGVITDYKADSLLLTQDQAQASANGTLFLVDGVIEGLKLDVLNPAHDVNDVILVTRSVDNLVLQAYVVDSIMTPLDPSGHIQLGCRWVTLQPR